MNNLRTILFFLIMGLYLWFPYSMIADQQRILKKGASFRFIPSPVDPYDAFRGRFIYLNLDNEIDYPDADQVFEYKDKVYLSLEQNRQGYAYFSGLSKARPAEGSFIRSTVQSVYKNKLRVDIPENLRRYYLNEKLAPLAEKRFNELSRTDRDSVNIYLDVRIMDGEALIEELYFEGRPVGAYLSQ